jgi:hypothetical protein
MERPPGERSGRRVVVVLALVLVALAAASPRFVPYNMDEFVHYHPLGCLAFPLSRKYDSHREGCGQYDLRLPFTKTFLPLRSYLYIGSLPVVPFYAFWKALKDPVAVRIQGVVFFLLASMLSARLVSVSVKNALLASLIFPVYFFSFLVDTGPVGLSLLLLLGALLFLRSALERPGQVALGVLAGFLCFLGVFCKPVFAWCLPAVLLFGGRQLSSSQRVREHAAALSGAALAFLLPLVFLGLSVDAFGDRYYEIIRVGGVSLESAWGVLSRMVGYVFDGSEIVPRTLELPHWPLDVLPALTALTLVLGGFLFSSEIRHRIAGWAALSLVTLGVTALTSSASWPHHAIFALFFLVLGLAIALEAFEAAPRARLVVLGLIWIYGTSLAVRLPTAKQSPESNASKDHLLAFVRREGLDRRVVQVHTAWGTFYISHLFGDPRRLVFYFRFREWTEWGPARLDEVRSIAEREGRGVLVISSRPEPLTNTPLVEAHLGPPVARFVFDNWEAIEYLR